MQNFGEQIKLLVELQGLDTHILRLEAELEAIPERIKAMDKEFEAAKSGLKKLEEGVKALLLKRKDKEGELEAKEGSIKKYQAQMYQVKTNKEYSALKEEIERVKADNSVIEEAVINILDQVDAENKKVAKEKEALKEKESRFALEKKKLEEEALRIRKEAGGYKDNRAVLAAKIDKNLLSKYEKVLKSKDGLAVVPVANDSCQGCFRVLPPQVINEIQMKSGLVFCENCSRILYIEE